MLRLESMITQQSQIKLNIPVKLKEYLEYKANKFGIPLAGYIRYLILKDVENIVYPVFQASKKTEKSYKEARQAEKEGKLLMVNDF